MNVHFEPLGGVGPLASLDATGQRRAAMFWKFMGGADEHADGDGLFRDPALARWAVRDDGGEVVAEWWAYDDAGLLFRAGGAELIGEAIQHGFVCRDRALWEAIAAAPDAPGPIAWAVGEDDRLWIGPPDPEQVLAELQEGADVPVRPQPPPASAPPPPGGPPRSLAPGAPVAISWQSRWWDGIVVAPQGDGYLVHYDRFGDRWNEVVGLDRLSARADGASPTKKPAAKPKTKPKKPAAKKPAAKPKKPAAKKPAAKPKPKPKR